jgi:hypothetical protein
MIDHQSLPLIFEIEMTHGYYVVYLPKQSMVHPIHSISELFFNVIFCFMNRATKVFDGSAALGCL